MSYSCPLCHQSLFLDQRTYRCDNNHQFDLAKEGYVNLMPAHHKRSKDPGDNKEMIQARRTFLNAEYYVPMRQRVAELLQALPLSNEPKVLDIGCGEGYYTHFFDAQLQPINNDIQVHGLDISKAAIRYAAKRYSRFNEKGNSQFCVASSHRLPFPDHSIDAIVRIYAPCKAEELNRVIKETGSIVTVTPGARHLYQLRDRIYDGVRLHSEDAERIEGFELISEEKVSYLMKLTSGHAYDLLQMTPFAWKATDELRNELRTCLQFECEADFNIRIYRKVNQ